jgi:hypothetical protein
MFLLLVKVNLPIPEMIVLLLFLTSLPIETDKWVDSKNKFLLVTLGSKRYAVGIGF